MKKPRPLGSPTRAPRQFAITASALSIVLPLLTSPFQNAGAEEFDFDRDIKPILSENCFHCHGPDAAERKANLRVDTRDGATADLGGYAAIVPGKASESELIARLTAHDADDLMPPPDSNRTLTHKQITLLTDWIEAGAPWAEHWAFIPPQRPTLPDETKNAKWPRNQLDHFILARLQSHDLTPSPPADKRTLIRRLSLDLTGLPPSPREIRTFLDDASPKAYEKLVDRLFASPHYGERMALPWLDAARYADSNGFQQDGNRHQWPWRDWVVQAMNDNMPFDQFTVEQLAGDLLPNPSHSQVIATAFNRNHMLNGEGGAIKEEQQVNYVADRVDTTSTVWLGLTMACAQCHDHKYDPISQKDYYRFFAYFNNIPETGGVDRRSKGGCSLGNMRSVQYSRPWLEQPTPDQLAVRNETAQTIKQLNASLKAEEAEIANAVSAWEKTVSDHDKKQWQGKFPKDVGLALRTLPKNRTGGQTKIIRDYYLLHTDHDHKNWRSLARKLNSAEKRKTENEDSIIAVMVMEELPKNEKRPTHILDRGDYQSPGPRVQPGTPAALPPLPKKAPKTRLTLARWLTTPDHPLTARVTVNRYWQTFFGIGIVKTTEDFGVQGEQPSHPDLLDWLSREFIDSGWNVKHIHRLIVTSAAYRQSSKVTPRLLEVDPENRLLARGARFRLPSPILRDQALATAGLLLTDIGGMPVYPYQPTDIWNDFSFGKITYPHADSRAQIHRRSLYTFWRRTVKPPNMFDASARQVCTVRSSRTNTPLQALTLLNDVTYVEAARAFAQKILSAAKPEDSDESLLARAFLQATGRHATAKEQALISQAFDEALAHFKNHPEAASDFVSIGVAKTNSSIPDPRVAAFSQVTSLLFNLDEILNKE
ncbi:MAG: PSD1 and planctomycete cytochrome C domain-containing protein [Verrucomicrobiota bacterium]